MSKTFQEIVQETAASVRLETAGTLASRSGIAWATLARHAHAALDRNGSEVASVELVDRLVEAVRAELAAEEAGQPSAPRRRLTPAVWPPRDDETPPRSGQGGA